MVFRFTFAISLLIWAVILHQSLWSLALFSSSLLLVYVTGVQKNTIIKTFRMLLWFFVPVLLFQSLFTPGSYIQFPFPLPVTVEGMEHGLLLCMHIATMYLAALAAMKLLSHHEWLKLLSYVPFIYRSILPTMIMVPPLKGSISTRLIYNYQNWKNGQQKYRSLPAAIVMMVKEVIRQSEKEAVQVWESWDLHMNAINQAQVGLRMFVATDAVYAFLCIVGWGLLWIR